MDNTELVIDVKNLNKSFDGKPAVINLELQVKRGEIFGFLGPNGSGKTTTIRMLCGLLTPDTAEGTCLGFDILRDSEKIKQRVGYMTQRFSLYDDLSVYENLDFAARLYGVNHRKQAIEEAIEELGLNERRKQLTGTLSGGWKQRLALSTALLHKPDLLLLDEPTAGVDPKARRDFWDKVHYLSLQGITTLVSTHYMDEAERCTRLAYVAYGNLLCTGTSDDIINQSHLTTWQVTKTDTLALSEKLQKMPGVDQVVAFGTALHVSGKNKALLETAIETIRQPGQQWREIEPSLEDVFITMVGEQPDKIEE